MTVGASAAVADAPAVIVDDLRATAPSVIVDDLRASAEELVTACGDDDALVQVAVHLIDCAADVVGLLPRRDLAAAQEALSCARAAVGVATYAVRSVHLHAVQARA